MKLPQDILVELAKLYGCTPVELQFEPSERERGRRLHEAMELVQELSPEAAQRWIEIGRLLKPQ